MWKIFNLFQAWRAKYTSEVMENPCSSQILFLHTPTLQTPLHKPITALSGTGFH